MSKINIWPDNPFLVFFTALLWFYILLHAAFLPAAAMAGILCFAACYFRVAVDQGFVTTHEYPGSKAPLILPRKNIRVVTASRRFGNAKVLDDRTSSEEIILYEWMYSRRSLARLDQVFANPVA